ncbi:flagellar protein FlaG [Methylomonas sp. AM2-LC]|uniref:flagellar protein FlaG n=1 Tax=Methylomonas sp. AM2-LC TaxID=3153301 RepID=UPI003266494C
MSSEIHNNLTLSTILPVASETNVQANSGYNSGSNSNVQVLNANPNSVNTPSLKTVKAAADQSNQFLQSSNLSVQYSVDKTTNETVIKVVDAGGKLVRQIPSTEMLDFVKRLQDMEDKQKGTVIQTSA